MKMKVMLKLNLIIQIQKFFQIITEVKLREGVIYGPQIYKLYKILSLTPSQLKFRNAAWNLLFNGC